MEATPLPWFRMAALLVIGALGAAAAFFGRRRARVPRMLEVVESLSLGNRRALVIAKMNGELLLLGSSEAGVALLTTRQPAAAAPEQQRPFEALLDETVEEEQLRRKLSLGRSGRVQ
ncbi:MAG TPA: flagellar biosynthetic protein FliO [Myxococcales bacterium]|nr:flagellar biosynthetic protein FliO [Myxococcales bacterium]